MTVVLSAVTVEFASVSAIDEFEGAMPALLTAPDGVVLGESLLRLVEAKGWSQGVRAGVVIPISRMVAHENFTVCGVTAVGAVAPVQHSPDREVKRSMPPTTLLRLAAR